MFLSCQHQHCSEPADSLVAVLEQCFQWCTVDMGEALYCAVWVYSMKLYYTSRLSIEPIPTGKIRSNVKFAAFWCVFLTKMKVDPKISFNKPSIKQLRIEKIPKDKFT